MAVGMEQLQVVRRVPAASAAPDPMVDVAVFAGDGQRLTAHQTSSLLSFPEPLDPSATCPRLGQLPVPPCFQVQFPLRIVRVDGAADLDVTNDLHLRCGHQLNGPAFAFLVQQHTGEDPEAVTFWAEVFLLDPLPALLRVPPPAPPPHHLEDYFVN